MPLWLAAISALPHKEERFLYVIYPLVRPQTSRVPEFQGSKVLAIASILDTSIIKAPLLGLLLEIA